VRAGGRKEWRPTAQVLGVLVAAEQRREEDGGGGGGSGECEKRDGGVLRRPWTLGRKEGDEE
jgi:hypothetical protein